VRAARPDTLGGELQCLHHADDATQCVGVEQGGAANDSDVASATAIAAPQPTITSATVLAEVEDADGADRNASDDEGDRARDAEALATDQLWS